MDPERAPALDAPPHQKKRPSCRRCRRADALVTTYVNDGYVLEMCVCRWCGKGSLRGLGEWYDIVHPGA